jgi:Protein of unknown function (DUF2892)
MNRNVGSLDRVLRLVAVLLLLSGRLLPALNGPALLIWLLLVPWLLLSGLTGSCPLYGLLGLTTYRRRPWPP